MNRIKAIAGNYPFAIAFAAISLGAALAMVLSRGTGRAYPLTVVASVSFILAGAAGGAHRDGFGRFMLAGLIGCCMGDLLGVYDFVWGALAFLVAHLAYIAAFLVQGIHPKRSAVSAGPVLLVGLLISFWLLPHVPRAEWMLVIPYMLVISAMVILALGIKMPRGAALLMAGAVVFYISDIFVARWQYVSPSGMNAYFCYPLYYSSCVLLALSIAARNTPELAPASSPRQAE